MNSREEYYDGEGNTSQEDWQREESKRDIEESYNEQSLYEPREGELIPTVRVGNQWQQSQPATQSATEDSPYQDIGIVDDSKLLDFLDSLPIPSGHGWKFRQPFAGRGWRLMTTGEMPNYLTAREAIYHAMVETEEVHDAEMEMSDGLRSTSQEREEYLKHRKIVEAESQSKSERSEG